MEVSSYEAQLCKTCDPEEIRRLSNVVFVEGHLDRLDDLIFAILPLANIVYYKYIRSLDDRTYAKEDLISDAVSCIYQDMTLRWDKYIHIEYPYEYFSKILRNTMVSLVHDYHNHYRINELDPEATEYNPSEDTAYDLVEMKVMEESIYKEINSTAEKLLRCRCKNTKLLLNILRHRYVDKIPLDSLRSRVRVLGVTSTLFDFYCDHVDYIYKLSYNYQYAILGGKSKMINRISSTISRFEDVTYRQLSIEYYDSIIPEIYAEFGAEVAKKFVRTFSGRKVDVPDYNNFCDHLLGGVVLSLAEGDKTNLYRVADEYGIPYRKLSRIYDKAIKCEIRGGVR